MPQELTLSGIAASLAIFAAGHLQADPSAQPQLIRQELLLDGAIARLRLVAVGDRPLVYGAVADAFAARCALVALELDSSVIEQVIVSIADRDVTFGETNPEAVQFFELYDLKDGVCIWKGF